MKGSDKKKTSSLYFPCTMSEIIFSWISSIRSLIMPTPPNDNYSLKKCPICDRLTNTRKTCGNCVMDVCTSCMYYCAHCQVPICASCMDDGVGDYYCRTDATLGFIAVFCCLMCIESIREGQQG